MSLMRRSAKRDANELEIVAALENCGCLVQRLSGGGVPDLMVWAPLVDDGKIVLIEIKMPKQRARKNPLQQAWRGKWRTAGAPVFVVETVEEAIKIVRSDSKQRGEK